MPERDINFYIPVDTAPTVTEAIVAARDEAFRARVSHLSTPNKERDVTRRLLSVQQAKKIKFSARRSITRVIPVCHSGDVMRKEHEVTIELDSDAYDHFQDMVHSEDSMEYLYEQISKALPEQDMDEVVSPSIAGREFDYEVVVSQPQETREQFKVEIIRCRSIEARRMMGDIEDMRYDSAEDAREAAQKVAAEVSAYGYFFRLQVVGEIVPVNPVYPMQPAALVSIENMAKSVRVTLSFYTDKVKDNTQMCGWIVYLPDSSI